jgi:hypothetical protein
MVSKSSIIYNNNNNSSILQNTTWEVLRKKSHQLEGEIEQKLNEYSSLIAQVGRIRHGNSNKQNNHNKLRTDEVLIENSNDLVELELQELINKVHYY